nr:trifunctional transcriptional activator/DNA repair protein Ada/methylated-DNA--[protein]-cysteine S-methyltransferase [Gammaproteobacteria bacterium]
MKSTDTKQQYYTALINKDSEYEGVFYVGVMSTGIFCRPTCPARKPKFENCEFFDTAEAALLASYRPCKRCQPLSHPNNTPPLVRKLVELVEANPEKRWRSEDIRRLDIDESTARRQFQKRFNMSFIEYARARRLGIAMKAIRKGSSIIDSQLSSNYDSASGFRDAFTKIMGTAPSKANLKQLLYAAWTDTPLGPMLLIANEDKLYLLEFVDRRGLEREIEMMRKRLKINIIPGNNKIIQHTTQALADYFSGKNLQFDIPIEMVGSPFQKKVWQALQAIPIGETISYKTLAANIHQPTACRAVAN